MTSVVKLRKPKTPKRRSEVTVERIRERCVELKITPHTLARNIGVHASTVHDLLSGKSREIKIDTLVKLATGLHCSLAYVAGLDQDINLRVAPRMPPLPVIGIVEDAMRPIGLPPSGKAMSALTQDKSPTYGDFRLEVRDDAMAQAPIPIVHGMFVECVDMRGAGLVVESGRIYAIVKTENGRSCILLRRARVFSDRTELHAESNSSIDPIILIGTLSTDPDMSLYAMGLVINCIGPQ